MKRRHGFLIAIVLAAATVAGTFAALQTAALGPEASGPSERQLTQADKRLDKQEARLRRAAKRHPPKLPVRPAASAPRGGAPAAAQVRAAAAPAPVPAGPVLAPSSSGGHDDDFEDRAEDRADNLEDQAEERAEALEEQAEERAEALEEAFDD